MPNYVTNIVAIDATEEQRKEVLEAIKGKDMPIDFNKMEQSGMLWKPG